jgi:biotin synthase-related radical SAM superfamily protein
MALAHHVKLTALSCDDLQKLIDAGVPQISAVAEAAFRKKGCPVR